jgi:hypothetical protein
MRNYTTDDDDAIDAQAQQRSYQARGRDTQYGPRPYYYQERPYYYRPYGRSLFFQNGW